MSAPIPVNPLIRPAENPTTRWGAPAPVPVSRIPANALRVQAPIVPAPVRRPMPDFSPTPVPEEERISPRVPVPKADFPEESHKELHEKVMGEAFDDPSAHRFVRDLYSIIRKSRPHIAPRTLLETIRDSHFAVKHGFMTYAQAGAGIGRMAHLRHLEAQARQPENTEEGNSSMTTSPAETRE